jgi:hypothetical protein
MTTATMLPPGLYLRRAGPQGFSSIFLLETDRTFRLRWYDGSNGTWLQGAGQVTMVLETVEARALKYEIRLQGDFACAVLQEKGDAKGGLETERLEKEGLETERLPKGFGEGAGKKAKKAKKGGGVPKGKLAPKKKKGGKASSSRPSTPEKPRPPADASTPASPAAAELQADDDEKMAAGGAEPAITVVEVRDGPYVIHEAVQCPPEAGETLDEMRAWIAKAAETALQSEFGEQRALEMRSEGYPFNHGVDVEWEEEDGLEASPSKAAEEDAMAC